MAKTATRSRPKATPKLGPPVMIKAGRVPIDVDTGHAAPFLAELDGSGKPSLLVGQFREGQLRVYTNVGTKRSPRFDPDFTWLKAGRKLGKVPFG